MSTTEKFMGLEIVVDVRGDGVPRCRDIDLGKFLGYSRPRDLRKLIESERRAGNLNDSDICAAASRVATGVASVEVITYWLTREAALFVASRSETKTGAEVLKTLIHAYEVASGNYRVAQILRLLFNDAPRKVQRMYSPLIAALLVMRGEKDAPGNPAWGPLMASLIYGWAFGNDTETGQQAHRRALNPAPSGSSVDYGFCSDAGMARLQRVIDSGVDQARLSSSWDEWRAKMSHLYEGQPLQLGFTVALRLVKRPT